jgi:ParB family chromosome partitioning protein
MRLLSLPESVRSQIEAGRLTAGHARALVATDSPAELAEQIIELGLSVRESEQLSRQRSAKPSMSRRDKDADTRALENSMSQLLGLAVRIRHGNSAGGTITIAYKSLDQLEEVCRRLQA